MGIRSECWGQEPGHGVGDGNVWYGSRGQVFWPQKVEPGLEPGLILKT